MIAQKEQVHLQPNPIIHNSFYKCVLFEFSLTIFYIVLIASGAQSQNTRVTIYCLLFTINQLIIKVQSLMETIDPLALSPHSPILKMLCWGLEANMLYQLGMLAYLHKIFPILVMLIHFGLNAYIPHKSEPLRNTKKKTLSKFIEFINPILLYSFLKEFESEQYDLSIIFLLLLCGNLFCASEMREILAHHEADFIGWSVKSLKNGSSKPVWDKKHALKLIIIGCSAALVTENFLLIFDSMKNEVCLNIVHTLIIAITALIIILTSNNVNL